mgnify:CR=1 FL=1
MHHSQISPPPQSRLLIRLAIIFGLVPVLFGCALPNQGPNHWQNNWQSPLSHNHPLAGKIWITSENRYVSPENLLKRLEGQRHILIGEKHNNPDHHRIQAWITSRLIDAGERRAMVLEMIRMDQQDTVDQYVKTKPGVSSSAGLGNALKWSTSGWGAWGHYEAILKPALAKNLPIYGANLGFSKMRAIARSGLPALKLETLKALRLGTDSPPMKAPIMWAMEAEIVQAHCGMIKPGRAGNFALIQLVRDASFAHIMEKSAKNMDGTILIAGAGHVRKDRGVPMHLRRLANTKPNTLPITIFTIAAIEVAHGLDHPEKYGEIYGAPTPPFDAIWFTPRMSNRNPCDRFKKKN